MSDFAKTSDYCTTSFFNKTADEIALYLFSDVTGTNNTLLLLHDTTHRYTLYLFCVFNATKLIL